MENLEFYDHIYQLWSKTTGAEDRYWGVTEHDHLDIDRRFSVDACDEDSAIRVGGGFSEADSDWITALHGCFPDLIRRLRELEDEVEQHDARADEQSSLAAELATDRQSLYARNLELDVVARNLRETISELKHEIHSLEEELSYAMGEEE